MNKKLYRNEHQKVLGGVCSGLAEYFEMDITVVRLLFAFTFFIMGVGLGTYIILWIVLPRKGYLYHNYNNPAVDYTIRPEGTFNDAQRTQNPFVKNPFGSDPFAGNPFGAAPADGSRPKQKSTAGIIIGLVLILVGSAILIDEFDLIPDFDFGRLWPLILVVVGGSLIVAGQRKEPWEKDDWKTAANTENLKSEDPEPTDNTPAV